MYLSASRRLDECVLVIKVSYGHYEITLPHLTTLPIGSFIVLFLVTATTIGIVLHSHDLLK